MFAWTDRIHTPIYFAVILWGLIVLSIGLGIHDRFIQDDAFISFRYAQHLAQGQGLTWNIGDPAPVEGYTDFLWVLMMAGVLALKLDPVSGSMALGLLFAVGTLFLTYRLAMMLLRSKPAALLTVLLLGTNYTFDCYMTGGLETQLQTFLVVLCAYLSFLITQSDRLTSGLWLATLSMAFLLAALTRLDSALICLVLYAIVFQSLIQKDLPFSHKLTCICFLTLPGLCLTLVWLYWKWTYYGDILPNTYYVKAAGFSLSIVGQGLWYEWMFLKEYAFIIFAVIGVMMFKHVQMNKHLKIMLLIIGLWCVYIIKIGGDFMEFRFFVPVLPFLIILVSYLISNFKSFFFRTVLVLLVILSSWHHGACFNNTHGLESITSLQNRVQSKDQNWQGVGMTLHDMFGASANNITIATTAAGAIPYYSELRTIDLLGLNDKWIARNGTVIGARPGHTRHANLKYLIDAKVNLVLGNPKVVPLSAPPSLNPMFYMGTIVDTSLLPDTSKIIEIPLDDQHRIDVLYLCQNDFIDSTVKRLHLKTYPILK